MNRQIPLWLKLAFSAWILWWAPAYLGFYGPQNYLWFCNITLFITFIGLWFESPLLISSQLVTVLLVDTIWTIDLIGVLLFGVHPIGGTEYMFLSEIPLDIRLLSLFHVFLPPLLIYAAWRIGYDERGWVLQTFIAWLALSASFLLTDVERHVNWVWGPFATEQTLLPAWQYLLVCMAAYPLIVFLPTHGLILGVRRLWRLRSR